MDEARRSPPPPPTPLPVEQVATPGFRAPLHSACSLTKKLLSRALSQLFFHVKHAGPVLSEQWGWCGTLPQKKRISAHLGLLWLRNTGRSSHVLSGNSLTTLDSVNATIFHLIHASVSFHPAPCVFARKICIGMKMVLRGEKKKAGWCRPLLYFNLPALIQLLKNLMSCMFLILGTLFFHKPMLHS